MLFANVCARFIYCCYEGCGVRRFLGIRGAPWRLVYIGVLALPVYTLMCAGLGLRRCAYRSTRPLGGGRWGHHLRDPRGVHWFAQKCASCIRCNGSNSICVMPYMLALAGQPSLHGYGKTSFPLFEFLFSRNFSFQFWEQVLWHLWIGRARHPGPSTRQLGIEVFKVGRWLTHGDLVLEGSG